MTTPDPVAAEAAPRKGGWLLVAPLLLVTSFAIYGQVVTGLENYTAGDDPDYVRWGVALGAAAAIESIALFVAWHAHDALLLKASATAARLRRASYLIAAAVATINYWHFSDQWRPTAAAVVFAVFSASGPWLWGLHTRRIQHLQLLREGQADSTGAVFSAERWRAFPLRTYRARRFSIDHGITDPREAWETYRAEKATLPATLVADRPEAVGGEVPFEPTAADRDKIRPIELPASDMALIADVREWAVDRAAVRADRPSRDDMVEAYGIGTPRARKIRRILGWADEPTDADQEPTGADR